MAPRPVMVYDFRSPLQKAASVLGGHTSVADRYHSLMDEGKLGAW